MGFHVISLLKSMLMSKAKDNPEVAGRPSWRGPCLFHPDDPQLAVGEAADRAVGRCQNPRACRGLIWYDKEQAKDNW